MDGKTPAVLKIEQIFFGGSWNRATLPHVTHKLSDYFSADTQREQYC